MSSSDAVVVLGVKLVTTVRLGLIVVVETLILSLGDYECMINRMFCFSIYVNLWISGGTGMNESQAPTVVPRKMVLDGYGRCALFFGEKKDRKEEKRLIGALLA